MENTDGCTRGSLPFDPIVVVLDVAKRGLLILFAALAAGIGAYIHAEESYRPVYRTSATFVVTAKGSSATVYTNLASTGSLASVFTELLNSSIMRKTILAEMGVPAFDGTVSTSVIPGTNLISMTVSSSDPKTAFLAARAILEHHEKLTYRVVDGIILDVLRYPTVPTAPVTAPDAFGRMKKAMALAALAAWGALAVLSVCRDTVRSGREARRKLDCDYLGELPHQRRRKPLRRKTGILITDPSTAFRYVESIRLLRHRVERSMDGGKVLMVTSLLEDEGKSTVAANLALAMTRKGGRVLLIDCDLRKPACHRVLGRRDFLFGVNDVLAGKTRPEEAVTPFKSTGMDAMFALRSGADPGELFSSPEMGALLRWARENYAFVVLDLPPMSAASDGESMAQLADGSLLVVRQNLAAAPGLNKAAAALAGGRAKLLGCVLNNVRSTRLFSGGGRSRESCGYYARQGAG